jgi:hypothetical protein
MAAKIGRAASLCDQGVLRTIAADELFIDESDQILPHLDQPWLFLVPGADLAIQPEHQLTRAKQVPGSRILWLSGEGHVFLRRSTSRPPGYIEAFLRLAL